MKRRKLLTVIFTLLAFAVASTFSYAQKDYEKVLDSGLTNDEAYSIMLVEQAKDSTNKQELLEEALKFSPDLPPLYFKLAWSSLPNVIASLQYSAGGIKAYTRSFWWGFSLVGLILASALVSLALASAIVALLRLPIQIPLLSHDINEGKSKLLIPLILLLAALGGPLMFIGGALAVVSIHLKKSNRAPIYLFLVLLAASPFLLKAANTMMTAAASPELRAMVAVNEGRGNDFALQILADEDSREDRFSYALALKRIGRYDEAEAIYNDLASKRPDWKVLNNLANIHQARNQTDEAKETLKEAVDLEKNAVLLYNLSQVYRGTLDYAEGDNYYREASALDQEEVSKYTSLVSTDPNRFVIDVTLDTFDFWKIAFGDSRKYISLFPTGTAPAVGLAVFLLLVTATFGMAIHSKAFRCSRCSKIVCNICSRDSRWGQMCPDCYSSLVRVRDMDRQKRVSALLSAYEHRDRIKKMVRVLSFLPPGIAQISVGRVLGGFIFLWAFCFGAVFIWLNPMIETGLAGFSHSWLNAPAILAMAIVYVSSTIYVNGRIESEWL